MHQRFISKVSLVSSGLFPILLFNEGVVDTIKNLYRA